MTKKRVPTILLLALTMLLATVFVTAPDAQALPDGAHCPTGTLVNDTCVVEHGPSTCADADLQVFEDSCVEMYPALLGLVCPLGAIEEFDSGGTLVGCYTLVAAGPSGECFGNAVPFSGQCRLDYAPILGYFTCVLPAQLVVNTCVLDFGPAECAVGTSIDGICTETYAPTYYCRNQVVTINMVLGASGLGTPGPDVILGTAGDDWINAGAGDDIVCASGGDDFVRGGQGHDRIDAGSGHDVVHGGTGRDTIFGRTGKDELHGQAGHDRIFGGHGSDLIRGGGGSDEVDGGGEFDTCYGGNGGNDTQVNCEVATLFP